MPIIYRLKDGSKTYILKHAEEWERAATARRYLATLPERLMPFVFWDVPAAKIHEYFPRVLAHCEVFFAWEASSPQNLIAIAWFEPVMPDSACLNAHFSFNSLKVAVGQRLAWRIFDELVKKYSCLIALIPDPLFGANVFAAEIGLRKLAALPGACNFHGRARRGQLWILDLWKRGWPYYPKEGEDGSPAVMPEIMDMSDKKPARQAVDYRREYST